MATRSAKSIAAEAAFRAKLAELGATLLEPYVNSDHPHQVRCAAGHECRPRPYGLRAGKGICRTCAGLDPAVPEAAFRASLRELGATLLEPRWLGTKSAHRVRCPAGHEIWVWASSVTKGVRLCGPCATFKTEQDFRSRVGAQGGVVLGPYVNTVTPVHVRCEQGHDCWPQPARLFGGRGICRICSRKDPATAKAAFHARVAELGGIVLGSYTSLNRPVLVRCAAGHECRAWPSYVGKGGGFCCICAGRDSATAKAAFLSRVAELGGTVLGSYVAIGVPVLLRCKAGHECSPKPNHVMQGTGLCRKCAGKEWDMFYVVRSDEAVKFGITSGDPRPRLRLHRVAGYRTTVRMLTDLPGNTAPDLEDAVRATLRLAGLRPIKGREYFDIDALAVVLDIVDNYPIPERDLEASKEVA